MPWYNPNVITSIPAKFADGTAAAPSITFTNNTDRGIYNDTATPAIGFTVGGAVAARIGAGQILAQDGSVGSPSYSFNSDAASGFAKFSATQYFAGIAGAGVFSWSSTGLRVPNTANFEFSSTAGSVGAPDAAIRRNAAGVVEVNNGTAGTFRDLIARTASAQGAGVFPTATTTQMLLGSDSATIPKLFHVDGARTANNRIHQLYFSGGMLTGAFVNDANSGATNWLAVTGGQAAGVTSIVFGGTSATTASFAGPLTVPSAFANAGTFPVAITTGLQAWLNAGVNPDLTFVDSSQAINNRVSELFFGGGQFRGRFVNDANNAATNWLTVAGGQALGITSILLGGTSASLLGFYGGTGAAQSTGYGTPTGGAKLINFPGATATLAQTSGALAQLLLDLKAIGILGA